MWKGLHQGFRDRVEPAVIVADAPGAVRLASKHDRCRVTRSGGLDPTSVQQVQKLAAKLRKLAFRETFNWSCPGHGPGARLEGQLDAAVRGQPVGWTGQHVGEFCFQRCKGWVIRPRQLEGGVDEFDRGKMEFRAIR